jgi:hypothetical protein
MRRQRRPPAAPEAESTLTPLDAGICLLGLESLHKIGLARDVSDADVLRFVPGVELPDAAAVHYQSMRHIELALAYLVEGLVAQHGMPESLNQ